MTTVKQTQHDKIRLAAEASFETFVNLVVPYNVMGHVHRELCNWIPRQEGKDNQLILLPRDHGKSRYAGFYVAWRITKNPAIRVLYISATANLAEKQLKLIKDIIDSKVYRRYWPDMTHKEVSKREKWTNSEMSVDHPKRKEEGIRDSTVFTGGLTTSLTGLHCDLIVLDDVVVSENALTEEGRDKVKRQYSLLSSIEGTGGEQLAVGTRYHPLDLYNDMIGMKEDKYDEEGNIVGSEDIYEVFQRQVEDIGDGTGEFIWPRQQRTDGTWFGFNREVLAKKRGKYLDKAQFRAQYYNDPNDSSSAPIGRELFQYYERKNLTYEGGSWHLRSRSGTLTKLNLVASVDFAYSLSNKSDYTAIVVVGIDSNRNKYVLDIERFRTTKISEYFERILALHERWKFRKLIAEVTGAQKAIVEALKDNYIKPYGLNMSVQDFKPTRHQGSKEERIKALLEPSYQNNQVFHYRGGNCQTLEEELVLQFPPHDDLKDALATAIEHSVPPATRRSSGSNIVRLTGHPRFGGLGKSVISG